MADENKTDTTLKTGDDPDKKTDDGSSDKGTQPEKTPETKAHTPEEVSRIVAREVAKAEKKFKEAADKAQADATKTETERLTGKISELEAQIRERDTRDAVIKATTQDKKYAARNPQAVYRLVKDELDIDVKGQITNLNEVLTQAKADYPELFGPKPSGSANGGEGAQQTPGFDMNANIRQMAGRGTA